MSIIDKNIIICEINNLFPNSNFILLTGSYLHNNHNNKKSDIDVVIITTEINRPYSEKLKIREFYLEFIFLPINNIENILKKDVLTNGILIHMFRNGQLVIDKLNLLEKILEYINYIEKQIHPKLTPFQINDILIKMATYVEDITYANDNLIVKISLINDILTLFTQLYINENNVYIGKGKKKFSCLKEVSFELYQNLENIINDCINTNDYEKFVDFIENNIRPYKLKDEFSQRDLQMYISSKHLIINLPAHLVKNNIIDLIKEVNRIYEIIDYSIGENISITINAPQGKSYYIIINKLSNIFNFDDINYNKIKLSSNNWKQGGDFKEIIKFAFNYNELKLIKPNDIFFGVDLFSKMLSSLPKEYHKIIIEFIYKLWIPISYDEGNYDINSLQEKKKHYLEQYKKFFKENSHLTSAKDDIYAKYIKNINDYFVQYCKSDNIVQCVNVNLLPQFLDKGVIRNIILFENYLSIFFSMIDFYNYKPLIIYYLNEVEK